MANTLSEGQAAIGMLLEEKYRLQRELGAGGMGQVFLAHHETIERDVAIKVLHRNLASDEEVRQRFETEARAIARLRHPNCVMLYEFGFSHQIGALFAVFEYVEGHSLEHWVGQQMPLAQVVEIGRQVAEGVEHAHGQKIIHRDLKPDNVMVITDEEDGSFEVKILDFGIARITEEESDTRLTRQGQMFGTPPYMSPEQIKAKLDVTFATDLYSIGVLLYELIEGRLPFIADTAIEIVMMHLNEEVPPMEREGLPEELRQIVMRCLEKDPADRFGSAKELARALSRVDLPEEESVVEPVVSAASAGEESSEVGHTALAFPGLELEEPVSSVEVDAEPPGVEEVDAEPPDVEDDVEVEESDAADPKRDSGAMQLLVESSPKSARATQISYSTEELAEGGQNKKGLIILAVLLLFGVAGAGTIAMLLASSDSSEEEVGAVSEQVQAEARPARGGASTPKVADGEEVAPAVTKEQAIDEVDGEEEQPLAMDEAEEDDEAEEESAQRGGALEEPSKSAERERSAGRAETGTGRGAAGAAGAAGGGRPAQREVKRDEGPASLSIGRRQRSTSEAKQEPEAAPPTGLSLQRRRRSGDDEKAATKDEEREQPSRLSIPQRR